MYENVCSYSFKVMSLGNEFSEFKLENSDFRDLNVFSNAIIRYKCLPLKMIILLRITDYIYKIYN